MRMCVIVQSLFYNQTLQGSVRVRSLFFLTVPVQRASAHTWKHAHEHMHTCLED